MKSRADAADRLLPAAGARVVVTRPTGQADDFAAALIDEGAEVVVRPLIRVEAPDDPEPLARAARQLDRYDWVIFTSANAVDRFVQALPRAVQPGTAGRPRIAAVGPVTAAALERSGVAVDVVPREHTARAIAAAITRHADLSGKRVLWPRAHRAANDLAVVLEKAGARVDAIEAYRTIEDRAAAVALARELTTDHADVLTFTSPSAVTAFVEAGGSAAGTCVAVLGPATAAEARRRGMRVDIEPAEHTTAALARAIGVHLAARAPARGGVRREGPDHGSSS